MDLIYHLNQSEEATTNVYLSKPHLIQTMQMSTQKDYSMATADVVDAEVRELVEKAYSRAKTIITTHIDILHKLAQLLIEKETVDGEEFMSLFIDGKAELYVG